jgi:hypothetical protein
MGHHAGLYTGRITNPLAAMKTSCSPHPRTPARRHPAPRPGLTALLLPALLLAGCGGTADESDPPEIGLGAFVITQPSGTTGATVAMLALARDDEGVTQVQFFRVSGTSSVLLGTASAPPYQLQVVLPVEATGTVRFFARATDTDANTTDSAPVTVTVNSPG